MTDAATQRQIDAARPEVSTWLTANAGSGKTRVLTQRVARLLLRGTPPQRILCLTYTKAAASEMQNRLFTTLGEWSMKPDADLRRDLAGLGVTSGLDDLDTARTLFARAIDTPGGLRIQTIHSFCAALLRRFPLEAGVSPMFRELDEHATALLHREILEDLARADGGAAIAGLAALRSGDDLAKIAADITKHRGAFPPDPDADAIWRQHGLPPGFAEAELIAETFGPGDAGLIADVVRIMSASDKQTDHTNAKKLAALDMSNPDMAALETLFGMLLYGSGAKANAPFSAKIDAVPTKDVRKANPAIAAALNDLMRRVERARARLCALEVARSSLALCRFAAAFLAELDDRKAAAGLLDFDDLILRTLDLLAAPETAQWVLFRLDDGIDHVLVDEAQDTSPAQWRIIASLTREFTAGAGARPDTERTIFVVGDPKQSIYSFQGARPEEFETMRRHFAAALAASGQSLAELSLDHSFRSSPAILETVDRLLPGGSGGDGHKAYFGGLPGRVDLWPLFDRTGDEEKRAWYDPTDMLAANDPKVLLAEAIADAIADMVRHGVLPDDRGGGRPISWGDILVLVQRRAGLFHEIIRACKARGLPVAGADRLRIGGELAVKDLTALLEFLALPGDDLSLAAALRSPLFGLDENDLFGLACGRGAATLWQRLQSRQADFPDAVARIAELRARADFLRPYELLEHVLTVQGGRRALLARLGHEAEEGIDALLDLALAYERAETPSLTGFLTWLAATEVEVKRQPDSAGDRIRVMTTHGAKGLESPIVILPDSADRKPPPVPQFMLDDAGAPVLRPPAERHTDRTRALADAARAADMAERERVLYVALTRAKSWLIVCAAGKAKADGDSWHGSVERALTALGAAPHRFACGPGLRLERGAWTVATPAPPASAPATTPAVPDWATAAAASPTLPEIVSPSLLGGEAGMTGPADGTDGRAAAARGTNLHFLLEHLPAGADPATLAAFLPEPMEPAAARALAAEARRLIGDPAFGPVFAADALAEVEVSALAPGGRRIHGKIDRMVVAPDRVLVVDFKSHAAPPATPDAVPRGILAQMGAYLVALEPIYPDRAIELAILWTSGPQLMPLPHDIVRAAFESATTS